MVPLLLFNNYSYQTVLVSLFYCLFCDNYGNYSVQGKVFFWLAHELNIQYTMYIDSVGTQSGQKNNLVYVLIFYCYLNSCEPEHR